MTVSPLGPEHVLTRHEKLICNTRQVVSVLPDPEAHNDIVTLLEFKGPREIPVRTLSRSAGRYERLRRRTRAIVAFLFGFVVGLAVLITAAMLAAPRP